ncbi:hypothetical protein HII31_03417 [Pseudocercospora fuligena]|uniref:Uncharacterized protein n=1 Tax=Pseudocercospora fuligena TaxID=685502 RepID=A0A8H6RMS4_9PEZI|nr:hypothetical protein HII31_03417 [Pseudocercospora fuligena]
MHFLPPAFTGLSASLALAQTSDPNLLCISESQPNPIRNTYPNDVTGTINGTTVIVPIPYSVARSVVPSQYGILTKAYEELIPGFPKDMYPAVFQGLLDHDVGLGPLIRIPDFQRAALKYPFVDRINDGYSSFMYSAPQLISATNAIALAGGAMYGETHPGNFDPNCNAYAYDGSKDKTYLTVYEAPGSKALGSSPKFDTHFQTASSIPYSQHVFVNITNQPSFGSLGTTCDNYITLYNTTVTQGKYAPVPVQGTVKVVSPYYPQAATLNAYGYRMDNSFIERNNVPCENLKGYSGTGPGDR